MELNKSLSYTIKCVTKRNALEFKIMWGKNIIHGYDNFLKWPRFKVGLED